MIKGEEGAIHSKIRLIFSKEFTWGKGGMGGVLGSRKYIGRHLLFGWAGALKGRRLKQRRIWIADSRSCSRKADPRRLVGKAQKKCKHTKAIIGRWENVCVAEDPLSRTSSLRSRGF